MGLITSIVSLFTFVLIGVIFFQVRSQRVATQALIADNQIRTRLYQDADESTTFILKKTIENISRGTHDPNLEADSFALKVIRELVKTKVSKSKWMEIQSNERLIHELFLLLRQNKN